VYFCRVDNNNLGGYSDKGGVVMGRRSKEAQKRRREKDMAKCGYPIKYIKNDVVEPEIIESNARFTTVESNAIPKTKQVE